MVKRKIPIGNPTCSPFVWCAKKHFNAAVDKWNMSSYGHIQTLVDKCNKLSHQQFQNLANHNTIQDPMEEVNNNKGYEEEQEGDLVVAKESTNVILHC